MRWAAFVALTFLTLAAELSLRPVLMFHSLGGVSPSFVACLAVFISMFAPRMTALWSCWLLGLLLDLSTPFALRMEGSFYLIGPYTLGYVCGCFLIIQLRPMVFRQRSLTIGFLTLLSLCVVALISVTIFEVRSWYAPDASIYPTSGSASTELFRRFGIAVYSALLAVPLGWFLLATLPYWGFPTTAHYRAGRR